MELWNFITTCLAAWDGGVVIFGDFNEVRRKSERCGSVFDKRGALEFNNFIMNNELTDLKLGGREFTYINKKGDKMSRLDRVMINTEMDAMWENIEMTTDNRLHSDHVPIIVKHCVRDYGPTPFKFFNSWLKEEECEQIVKETWDNFWLVTPRFPDNYF